MTAFITSLLPQATSTITTITPNSGPVGTTVRVVGEIDKNGFFEKLDLTFSHGGVGLRREVAEDMTRRIEILMIKFKDYTE